MLAAVWGIIHDTERMLQDGNESGKRSRAAHKISDLSLSAFAFAWGHKWYKTTIKEKSQM
jgi:hypothetical protein